MDDVIFDGDGSGRVDVVISDYADGDVCSLVFADSFWDLGGKVGVMGIGIILVRFFLFLWILERVLFIGSNIVRVLDD